MNIVQHINNSSLNSKEKYKINYQIVLDNIPLPASLWELNEEDFILVYLDKAAEEIIEPNLSGRIQLSKALPNEYRNIFSPISIIIVEYKDIQFCLLVEKINEMIAVDSKFMTTSLQFIPELKQRYIQGTIEFEDRKLILLNIERIVTDIGCI